MKLLLVFISILGLQGMASALILSKDTMITDAAAAMKRIGYAETGLQMEAAESDQSLRYWSVSEGVLIVRYSTASGKILGLSYYLSDERARGIRKNFDLKVTSFDSDKGEMVIQMGKPPAAAKKDEAR